MLPLLACGAGIYLGLNFNVLVLLPLSLAGAGALIFASWSSGQSLIENFGLVLFPLISMQAGYVLGLTARDAYAHLLARLNLVQSKRI
jgi:hypothetical protein